MSRHLSLALALAATALLAVGLLVGNGLALIYLSIACSTLALIALIRAWPASQPTSTKPAAPGAPPGAG